ncbi:hypothetical protein DPMN_004576, partial [Dreissena polymorpha]
MFVCKLIFVSACYFSTCGVLAKDDIKLRLDGDIIFGGLFPMHEKGQNGENCGDIKREKGIQRMEAMLFAVDRINKDQAILPGLTVGVHILDTCSFDTYALEQCMDFIKAQMTTIDLADYKCRDGHAPKYVRIKPVSGVIGAAASTVSIMVANILRLFKPLDHRNHENEKTVRNSEINPAKSNHITGPNLTGLSLFAARAGLVG